MTYLIIKGTLVAVAVVGYGVYRKLKGHGGMPPMKDRTPVKPPKDEE